MLIILCRGIYTFQSICFSGC